MNVITQIRKPVAHELKVFQQDFKKIIRSRINILDAVNRYIIRKKGKEIRPLLVFLSAKLCGTVNASTYTAATLVQLFHTATLLHDDVVDQADMRRGMFSVNAIWKSKVAVLAGDFFLSKSMLIALENKEFELLEIISNSVKEMSEGELMQFEKSRKLDLTEAVYLEIIRKKTATLLSSCAAAGASSAKASPEVVERLREFGSLLGIAFQMRDDLLDMDQTNLLGKHLYNDIRERKMTLPVIYALQQADDLARKKIWRLFKKKQKKQADIEEIVSFIRQSDAISYTQSKMQAFHDQALALLHSFEQSEAREALEKLLDFAVSRKK